MSAQTTIWACLGLTLLVFLIDFLSVCRLKRTAIARTDQEINN